MSGQRLPLDVESVWDLMEPDRRSWVRYPCGLHGSDRVIVADGRQSYWARVRNVSVSGIGLLLSRSFAPGTVLTIRLRGSLQPFPPQTGARVVYSTYQVDGTWAAGCIFETPLTFATLQTFR